MYITSVFYFVLSSDQSDLSKGLEKMRCTNKVPKSVTHDVTRGRKDSSYSVEMVVSSYSVEMVISSYSVEMVVSSYSVEMVVSSYSVEMVV